MASFKNNEHLNRRGQVFIEFVFCMIIVLLMVYGLMKVMRWTGFDWAGRRIAHEERLIIGVDQNYNDRYSGPFKQVVPVFHMPEELNAVWDGH